MFDITSMSMTFDPGKEDEPVKVTIAPRNLYPAIITRIQECLEGANPSELLASAERGGSARAVILMRNARSLSAQAWIDALRPRDEFSGLSYRSFVDKNGQANMVLVNTLSSDTRPGVMQMIQRGYALEIALGWFCQALRLEFGAYDLTIEKDESYQL